MPLRKSMSFKPGFKSSPFKFSKPSYIPKADPYSKPVTKTVYQTKIVKSYDRDYHSPVIMPMPIVIGSSPVVHQVVQPAYQPVYVDDDRSGGFGSFLGFLLLLAVLAGGLYWFFLRKP